MAEKHSYGGILKSSALIGGSSMLNVAISIVRTKAMAVLLGPAGFGLMSLYGSIVDLALSMARWASTVVGCARSPRLLVQGTVSGLPEPSPYCGEQRSSSEYWALFF